MPHAADSDFRIHPSSTKEAGISGGARYRRRNDYICSINPKPAAAGRRLLPDISFLFRGHYSTYLLLRLIFSFSICHFWIKFIFHMIGYCYSCVFSDSVKISGTRCIDGGVVADSKVSYTRLAPNEVRPGKQVLKSLRFALCRPSLNSARHYIPSSQKVELRSLSHKIELYSRICLN